MINNYLRNRKKAAKKEEERKWEELGVGLYILNG